MPKASILAIAGLATTLAVAPALAQTNPYARTGPQPRETYGSYRSVQPSAAPRGYNPYSVPRGYGGTIQWNTPNADGNLGGPGSGGSAGSGG